MMGSSSSETPADFNYVPMDITLKKILTDETIMAGDEESSMREMPMTNEIRVKMLKDYVVFLKAKITELEKDLQDK